jgi:hypothetical protein
MKTNIKLLLCISIVVFILLYIAAEHHRSIIQEISEPNNIPIVVICWNNPTFIKMFVNQLKKYPNPIIILDNKSEFPEMPECYRQIKSELNEKVDIVLLDKNYGSDVYKKLKNQLPNIYILSDPDLELNPNMPINFAEHLLNISNKYKSYKVGAALDISEQDKLLDCPNYTFGKTIYEWESKFWKKPVNDNEYELYWADTDTTLCLINNNYRGNKVRVAGVFTAKHLPWYKDYIKNNISQNEIDFWKKNNKSSSILHTCLKL